MCSVMYVKSCARHWECTEHTAPAFLSSGVTKVQQVLMLWWKMRRHGVGGTQNDWIGINTAGEGRVGSIPFLPYPEL